MKEITKTEKLKADIIPIIKNLAAMNLTQSDIGILLGYQGSDPKSYIANLKRKYPEVADAWKAGVELADLQLIARAVEVGFGLYETEVTEIEYKYLDVVKEDGTVIPNVKTPVKQKVKRTKAPPDGTMLRFLLVNRMPDLFADAKKINPEDKKWDLDKDYEQEIKKFAGKLLEMGENIKKVKSKNIVEADKIGD